MQQEDTELEIVHDETAEPYGEFTITVTTADPEGITIEVDPEGFGVRLSSDDAVDITLNQATLRQQDNGDSTYTITVDIIGGTAGDIGDISVWTGPQEQDDRNRVVQSTMEIVEADSPNGTNDTDGNSTVTGEIDRTNNATTNETDETNGSSADPTPVPNETNSSSNGSTTVSEGTDSGGDGGPNTPTIVGILGVMGSLVVGYYAFGVTKKAVYSLSIDEVTLTGAGKTDPTDPTPPIIYRLHVVLQNNGIEPTTISAMYLQTESEKIELFTGNGPDGIPTWTNVTVENRSELSLKGFGEQRSNLSSVSGELIIESTHNEIRKQINISPAMKF